MPPCAGIGLRTPLMPFATTWPIASAPMLPGRAVAGAQPRAEPLAASGVRPFTPSPKRSTAWPSFSVSTTNSAASASLASRSRCAVQRRRSPSLRTSIAGRTSARSRTIAEAALAVEFDQHRRIAAGHAHARLLRQRRDGGAIQRIARHASAGQAPSTRPRAARCRHGRPARHSRRRRPCRVTSSPPMRLDRHSANGSASPAPHSTSTKAWPGHRIATHRRARRARRRRAALRDRRASSGPPCAAARRHRPLRRWSCSSSLPAPARRRRAGAAGSRRRRAGKRASRLAADSTRRRSRCRSAIALCAV